MTKRMTNLSKKVETGRNTARQEMDAKWDGKDQRESWRDLHQNKTRQSYMPGWWVVISLSRIWLQWMQLFRLLRYPLAT